MMRFHFTIGVNAKTKCLKATKNGRSAAVCSYLKTDAQSSCDGRRWSYMDTLVDIFGPHDRALVTD